VKTGNYSVRHARRTAFGWTRQEALAQMFERYPVENVDQQSAITTYKRTKAALNVGEVVELLFCRHTGGYDVQESFTQPHPQQHKMF
jgi:hypothetical protein